MNEIRQAVARWLEKQTGVTAVAGPSPVGRYPLLSVDIRQESCTLVDGGRQEEGRYTVTVTAASDRDREGAVALLDRLVPPLLRGIPMEDRVLRPMEVSTREDRLSFSLCLCRPLPQPYGTDQGQPGFMEHLHLTI